MQTLVVRSEEGTTYHVLGGDIVIVKAGAEETDGAFTLFEITVPVGGGPPPHIHHREDESFYVIEGEFEFHLADQTLHCQAGDFLIAPRDLPHTFRNCGSSPGRLLIVIRPAGFEKFFEEYSHIPIDAPPDFAAMAALGAKYGLEFLPIPS